MAGTQASRQRLYRELGELLSQEAMDELMDAIPPVGWGDIARRQDLTTVEVALRQDVTNLDVALRGEMARLRGEMHTEFATVRTELTTALRTQLFAMLGAMFTLAGLTWAASSIA